MYANSVYKNSFELIDDLKGGRLYLTQTENEIRSYLLKYNLADANEYIYSWQGLKRKNARSKSLGRIDIINIVTFKNNLAFTWKQKDELFFGIVDSKLEVTHKLKIPIEIKGFGLLESDLLMSKNNKFILLVNDVLFLIDTNIDKLIEIDTDILCVTPIVNNNYFELAYLKDTFNSGVLYFYSHEKDKYESSRIDITDNTRLCEISNNIVVLSEYPNQSLLQFIKTGAGFIKKEWVNSRSNMVKITKDSINQKLVYLEKRNGQFVLVSGSIDSDLKVNLKSEVKIETSMVNPLSIELVNDTVYVLFRNGLISATIKGEVLSSDHLIIEEHIENVEQIYSISNNIIVRSETGTIILGRNENNYWWFFSFYNEFQTYMFIVILILFLFLSVQLFRHSRRTISTLIELPTAGAVFMLDRTGRLVRTNDLGKKVLDITENVPKRKQFHYYCMRARTQPIMELIEKATETRENINQKINLTIGNELKEWLCNVHIIRNITGAYRGLIFTGIDITEELERKRLTNWAQLAHDMQTNLTTIRLNTERIVIDENHENAKRREKIIHQTNLLIQRVRDIVTVGRSDELEKNLESSAVICEEVLNEFDSQLFPNVDFKSEIQDYQIICDKPKLIRAIRNAIENGIRALKGNKGIITLTAERDSRFAYFSIGDTGVGLKKEEIDKILTPYYTTSKHLGGSGIGTMIMQRVAELHGGKIEIQSDVGKGTTITFVIPNKTSDK